MSLPKEGSRDVQDGIIVSVVPDICLTPAGGGMVPVPYTIWCRQADAANLANTVRQTDDRSHAVASIVVRCYGDEPGTGGGIFSGTTGAECTPKTWSQTVRAEGRNMVRHLDEWWMNHRNTYGQLLYIKDMNQYNTPNHPSVNAIMKSQIFSNKSNSASTPQASQQLQASWFDNLIGTSSLNENEDEIQRQTIDVGGYDRDVPPQPQPDLDGYGFDSTGLNKGEDERSRHVRITQKCCIAPYSVNASPRQGGQGGCARCTGKRNVSAHHGMVDYPFRTGTVADSKMRAPGAPPYQQAATICVPSKDPDEHGELHRNFEAGMQKINGTGIVTFGQVKQLSFDEIDALPPSTLSSACKSTYKGILSHQYNLLDSEPLRGVANPSPESASDPANLETLQRAWGPQ